jgi:hypothetical protein
MPSGEIAAQQRLHVGRARFSAEALYIALITALAVFGMSRWSHRPVLLIATLLAMPCGLVALFGLYALTGLFNSIAGSFSDVQTSGTPVGRKGSASTSRLWLSSPSQPWRTCCSCGS